MKFAIVFVVVCVFMLKMSYLYDNCVAHAGAWTTPEGVLWSKVGWFYLNSDRLFFDELRAEQTCSTDAAGNPVRVGVGGRGPYDCMLDGGGGLIANQLFWESALGIHERVDIRLQVPVFLASEFVSAGTPQTRRGLGDIRFGSQVLILPKPVVLAASMHVKAPTGFFTPDAVGAPLGEGQWDMTFRGLVSGSFLNGQLWTGGELGYRVRLPNDDQGVTSSLNVGDEVLAVLETGGRPLSWLYGSLRWDMQYGFESSDGLFVNLPGRRIMYVQPAVLIQPASHTTSYFKDFGLEFGVRVPVWGRNWPADPIYFLGIVGSVRVFSPYSSSK